MKQNVGEIIYKAMLCVLAALIPLLLIAYGFQTRRYAVLAREIRDLELRQEELVEQNKKLVGDISLLASSSRVEKIASEELGMHKAKSEDIVRVEMDGAKK